MSHAFFVEFPRKEFIFFFEAIQFIRLKCSESANIAVQGFCPLKIKITQFPGGSRLITLIGEWY